jgi:hypothetical protein
MTSLKEIIEQIKARPNFVFDITAGAKSLAKKHSASEAEAMHGSLENYFAKITEHHKGQDVAVTLFAPNGSSYLRKNFFLLSTIPVVEQSTVSTTKVETPTTKVEPLGATDNIIKKPTMSEFATKTDIENAKLSTENKFLAEKVDEQKERIKKLERDNDELNANYRTLRTQHETNHTKHELEYKQKVLEIENNRKAGLGGIVEDVKSLPPEAWEFFRGVFGKEGPKDNKPGLEGPKKHADADAQACIDGIGEVLLTAGVDTCGKIALIVESMAKDPKILNVIFDKLFPGQQKQETQN